MNGWSTALANENLSEIINGDVEVIQPKLETINCNQVQLIKRINWDSEIVKAIGQDSRQEVAHSENPSSTI